MKVRRVVLMTMVVVASAVIPRAARAQLAIAPFVGKEFDEESDWLLFGGEARIALSPTAWSLNPRLTYHPLTGGSILQLDANAVYDFKPASGPFTPYLGGGLGWVHFSSSEGGNSSKVAANFVAGLRWRPAGDGKMEPYVHSEYTFAKQFTNSYQMAVGLLFWTKK